MYCVHYVRHVVVVGGSAANALWEMITGCGWRAHFQRTHTRFAPLFNCDLCGDRVYALFILRGHIHHGWCVCFVSLDWQGCFILCVRTHLCVMHACVCAFVCFG